MKRNIMFLTKTPCSSFIRTCVDKAKLVFVGVPPICFVRNRNFNPINQRSFKMKFIYMLGLSKNHKIINTIIELVSVYMMDYFVVIKFSANLTLNNISMFKHSNPVSRNPFVTIFTNPAVHYTSIFGGVIKRTVPPKPFIMHITNIKRRISNRFVATNNFTHIYNYSTKVEGVSI